MKIVTVSYVISDQHNIDSIREHSIKDELILVQQHSDHGLVYLGHTISEIPFWVKAEKEDDT